ncbi:MAG: nicotinate-nucleotide adenylyltransferase [Actinomycetes bacterium]
MASVGSRIGVLGGTFDPIHTGHLLAASEVASVLGLELVVFVPTGQPWQKAGTVVSAAQDRYLMTVLATADDPRFDVSRVDIDREGPTYAVDTLRDLHRQFGPGCELFFIVGSDTLAGLPTWHEPHQVVKLAQLVAVARTGQDVAEPSVPGATVLEVSMPTIEISATQCRERIAAGRSIDYLVPAQVVSFIKKRGLYR